ncbi:MAG: ECF transporter S component [Emergencia sp.]|nr:ECF transporter S component [Emergencia sp.]
MNKTVRLAKLAMMVAISCVLVVLIRIPFPPAPFLEYDPADVPIYITTFAFGPGAGLLVTLIVSVIQAFVLGGAGVYGFLMHMIATGLFVIVAGFMYRHKKTKKEAIMALAAGVVVTVIAMCVFNYFITPLYMGVPTDAVLAMIPTVIIPFNILKAGINALITFFVYKRISGFLHKV